MFKRGGESAGGGIRLCLNGATFKPIGGAKLCRRSSDRFRSPLHLPRSPTLRRLNATANRPPVAEIFAAPALCPHLNISTKVSSVDRTFLPYLVTSVTNKRFFRKKREMGYFSRLILYRDCRQAVMSLPWATLRFAPERGLQSYPSLRCGLLGRFCWCEAPILVG